MKGFHTWAAAMALVATGAAVPAQAHCWSERETAAAQVREMQTMLMVAALRCRAAHMDISADYDGFVMAQKDTLARANLVIKQHFAANGGNQSDYDRFTTSLANGFGDDATTEASCAEAATLAHDGSASAPAALEPLAIARVFPVALPEGRCAAPATPVVMAVVTRPEAQPPVVMMAAPAAEPVMLPADVVAAMAVMARYRTQQAAPVATADGPPMFAAVQR